MSKGRAEIVHTLSGFTDTALSAGLISVALVSIFLAVFVKNKWIKAGFLAWELLP